MTAGSRSVKRIASFTSKTMDTCTSGRSLIASDDQGLHKQGNMSAVPAGRVNGADFLGRRPLQL
jgi:hypothetical protein